MPSIPDSAIDDVRSASDLVDVVSDRVRLKKQGKNYMGLCPFHNEKSPSFSVDSSQNLYYCFGCRRGGDVFKFIQEIEGVGFLDSVRLLADRAGIEIQEEGADNPEADRRATMIAALRFAAGYYYRQLGTAEGARGLEYLKSRGFSQDAVREFGIGIALPQWDGLVEAATESGYKPDVLEAVGLAKQRQGGGFYDVFRDRLMFPILSPIGKVLGFGGRILPDTETGSDDYQPAKYVNSPETEVYQKSRVLYGMKQSKRAIRTEREVIVVEGYADVVSLWDAGVRNVVAASGTALGNQQVMLLKKMEVEKVVLLFDSDDAGLNAAWKTIVTVLEAGLDPRPVMLPGRADPDEFVKEVKREGFIDHVRNKSGDVIDFIKLDSERRGFDGSPQSDVKLLKYVIDMITSFSLGENPNESLLHDRYIMRASDVFDLPEAYMRKELRERFGNQKRSPRRLPEVEEPQTDTPTPGPVPSDIRPEESSLIRLMLEQGLPMVEHILTRMGVEEFTPGPAQTVVQALIEQFGAGSIDVTPFVRGDHGDGARVLVQEALAERHGLSDNWHGKVGVTPKHRDDNPFASAAGSMRLLKLDRVQEAVTHAMSQMQSLERSGGDISDLQRHVNELNALRGQIERGEFMEWTGDEG